MHLTLICINSQKIHLYMLYDEDLWRKSPGVLIQIQMIVFISAKCVSKETYDDVMCVDFQWCAYLPQTLVGKVKVVAVCGSPTCVFPNLVTFLVAGHNMIG